MNGPGAARIPSRRICSGRPDVLVPLIPRHHGEVRSLLLISRLQAGITAEVVVIRDVVVLVQPLMVTSTVRLRPGDTAVRLGTRYCQRRQWRANQQRQPGNQAGDQAGQRADPPSGRSANSPQDAPSARSCLPFSLAHGVHHRHDSCHSPVVTCVPFSSYDNDHAHFV